MFCSLGKPELSYFLRGPGEESCQKVVICTFNSLNGTGHLVVGTAIFRPFAQARGSLGGTGQMVIGSKLIGAITQERKKKDKRMCFNLNT